MRRSVELPLEAEVRKKGAIMEGELEWKNRKDIAIIEGEP